MVQWAAGHCPMAASWQRPRNNKEEDKTSALAALPPALMKALKLPLLQHVCLFVSEHSAEARVWLAHWLVRNITALVKGGVQTLSAPEFTLPTGDGFGVNLLTVWAPGTELCDVCAVENRTLATSTNAYCTCRFPQNREPEFVLSNTFCLPKAEDKDIRLNVRHKQNLTALRPCGRVSAMRLEGCEFNLWLSQTKDYKNGTQCLPAGHSASIKGLDWWVWNTKWFQSAAVSQWCPGGGVKCAEWRLSHFH